MNMDELREYFSRFEKSQPSIDKIKSKKAVALAAINQEVRIRDLVVRTSGDSLFFDSFGEAKGRDIPNQPTTDRLKSHIFSLFSLANEDHRANYCEKTSEGFVLKKGNENHVTRLTTHEFFFYTQTPLTMDDFGNLCNEIYSLSPTTGLDQNVHVLLSSFAVEGKDGKVLNMSIYVEGGNPPKTHTFSKNTASGDDKIYKGKSPFSQKDVQ
ncbi:hypothetical protein GAMM_60159 [Gammaproteobacteria bacterium]